MEPRAKGEKSGETGQSGGGDEARVDVRAEAPNAGSLSDSYPNDHLVSDVIGKALQAHYRALANAPLPDRFRVLLAQLEANGSQDD